MPAAVNAISHRYNNQAKETTNFKTKSPKPNHNKYFLSDQLLIEKR